MYTAAIMPVGFLALEGRDALDLLEPFGTGALTTTAGPAACRAWTRCQKGGNSAGSKTVMVPFAILLLGEPGG